MTTKTATGKMSPDYPSTSKRGIVMSGKMYGSQTNEAPAQTEPEPAKEISTPEPWKLVIDQLRAAHDTPAFEDQHRRITERIRLLLENIAIDPAMNDPWLRTRAAWLANDLNRTTGWKVVIPETLRGTIDRVAFSAPGLKDPTLERLLQKTRDLPPELLPLTQDVRHLAIRVVTAGEINTQTRSRILAVEQQVNAQLAK
jgi:hypothetical protein